MGRLRYVEHRPRPDLADHLECLWEVTDPRRRTNRPLERVLPDGCPELIVHLSDLFRRRVGDRWLVQPRAFLAGTLTRPWLLRAGNRIGSFGMRFRPGAPTAFFRVDMRGARDRAVPLSDLVGGAAARALIVSLRRARTAEQRFLVAEDWLRARIQEMPTRRVSVQPGVDAILRTRGRVAIQEVARSLGWSRRRMERAFQRDLGIRPKLYARIVRLNAVLATLDEADRQRAVDLALDAGYFDQAHLLRDFRRLAGRRPRAGRESDGEMARHFTHPERLRPLFLGE